MELLLVFLVFAVAIVIMFLTRPRSPLAKPKVDEHVTTFAQIKREERSPGTFGHRRRMRPMRKSPTLAAPYVPSTIYLTPRQLERVNIERRRLGKPALNIAGIQNAVAHAWDQPRKQPDNGTDWITYLILYEVLFADHQSSHCHVSSGIAIDPEKPYNGQGGEFAGAGASGSWTNDPAATAVAVGIAVSASHDPLSDPASFKGSSDYSAPSSEPAPAPDPTPSSSPSPSVSDSSSSYSSSSDSSSSYSSSSDSGSSFSSSSSDSGSSF